VRVQVGFVLMVRKHKVQADLRSIRFVFHLVPILRRCPCYR